MDQDLREQLQQFNQDIARHRENAAGHATNHFLDTLLHLISSRLNTCDQTPSEISKEDLHILKDAVRSFATVLPHMFERVCLDESETQMWANMNAIIDMITDKKMLNHPNAGVRLNVVKCMQVLAMLFSKKDPSAGNDKDDISLDVAKDRQHELVKVQELEERGVDFLNMLSGCLFEMNQPTSVKTAVVHSLIPLTAKRPKSRLVVAFAYSEWYRLHADSPLDTKGAEKDALLEQTNTASLDTRTVKKIIAVAFESMIVASVKGDRRIHDQLREIFKKDLGGDLKRLDYPPDKERHEARRSKRPLSKRETEAVSAEKRLKRDNASPSAPARPTAAQRLADFDVTRLPLPGVIEFVISLLGQIPQQTLGEIKTEATPAPQTTPPTRTELAPHRKPKTRVKAEPPPAHAPLASVQERASQSFKVQPYELPALEPRDQNSHATMLEMSMTRILEAEGLLQPNAEDMPESAMKGPLWRQSGKIMWLLLVAKLVTRGVCLPTQEAITDEDVDMDSKEAATTGDHIQDPQKLRHILLDFIATDLPKRVDLALEWLYEEYHCDIAHEYNSDYEPTSHQWLLQLLRKSVGQLVEKDTTTLTKLLLDSPTLTEEVIDFVHKHMLETPTRFVACLKAFIQLASYRLPVRARCLKLLLNLCVDKDVRRRDVSILAVSRLVSGHISISSEVELFAVEALQIFRQKPPEATPERSVETTGSASTENEGASTDGGAPKSTEDTGDSAVAEAPQTPDALAEWKAQALLQSSLFFNLFVKKHELLSELFSVYIAASEPAQVLIRAAIEKHVLKIGMRSPKLIESLREVPRGGETLVIRILKILCRTDRPTPELVAAVKDIYERLPDGRFLVCVASGLSKEDIRRSLPKIVELLNETEGQRHIVQYAFSDIVARHEKFAAIMTPSELLVALHEMENEVSTLETMTEEKQRLFRRQRWEAIRTCLDKTDIFGPKDIKSALESIIQLEHIPTMVMVTMNYTAKARDGLTKIIVDLLQKLVQKKVWRHRELEAGFIKCIETTLPESVRLLAAPYRLQGQLYAPAGQPCLPKAQLRDILKELPAAHKPLREFVEKNEAQRTRSIMKEMSLIEEA